MGEFDDLIGEPIPERKPTAPEPTDEDITPATPPADTRSQRRAYKAYILDQLHAEGCTCQRPYPKIRFMDEDDPTVPEGAVPMTSEHESRCAWLKRLRAGTN